MNFFKRAVLCCGRQKIRGVILLLLFTALATMALIALSVSHASAESSADMKKTIGASIRIALDESRENFGPGQQTEGGVAYQYNGDYITQEIIDAISKVAGVTGYSAETESGYWGAAVNFDYFPGAFQIDYSGGRGQPVPYTVTFNSQLSRKFLNGTYTLTAGRHIGPKDSFAALISKELADKNQLSVGDRITMYDLDTDSENTFEIVGIFSGTEGMSKNAMMADGIAANQGYIDGNSYQKMWKETTLELGSLDVYIDSAENADNLLSILQNLPELKGKTFTYSVNTENFDLISDPLSSLRAMGNTAVLAVTAAGAALVTFLLFLRTRGRKREAGILMALGRSKGNIVLQFLTETILTAVPAAWASWGFSALLSERIRDFLAGQSSIEASRLHTAIRPADLAAVYGFGALILVLAVLLASVTVLRMKPGRILSKME